MGLDARVKVVGVQPADETWERMKAVWDSCVAAAISIPDEVGEFFDWEDPGLDGKTRAVEKAIAEFGAARETMCLDLRGGSGSYYLIDLKKLPKEVTHLKVWMDVSY